MRSPIVFPYTSQHGHPAPIIPIEARSPAGWIQFWAYVDSGASFSIFALNEAGRIGLNAGRGRKTLVTVGDGAMIPVFLHRLPVRIGSYRFPATIGFSPRLGVGFNLLGRKDFFDKFDVTFSDSRRRITFKPVR